MQATLDVWSDVGRAGLEDWIRSVLVEDIGPGDATTEVLVPAEAEVSGRIVARQSCVIAGVELARHIFRRLDPDMAVAAEAADGDAVAAGAQILSLRGRARAILTGERTALNVLQRLMGIATLTRRFVDLAAGRIRILDTRKTTPGLRGVEKYAVRCGGGVNHRFGLFDRILIKDNHRALWSAGRAASLADAVKAARAARPDLTIEIEVESEAELEDALAGGPDWVLLDNMPLERIHRCVALCAGRAMIEISGGVGIEDLDALAVSGADAVSVGALTHSAPAVDLSLELDD